MGIVKTCIRHGDINESQCKRVIEKRWGIQPNYKYKCLQCIYIYNQRYIHKEDDWHQERIKKLRTAQKIKHHDKLLESRSIRNKKNRKKLNLAAMERRSKNKEKFRKMEREQQKKWRDELNDNYIKSQLRSKYKIKHTEVHEWMIPIKRAIIQLRRKIREIKENEVENN